LTFEAEDRVARDHADMDALAVEYIAVHDRPPIEVPHGKGCACWAAIARQIALGLFSLRLQPLDLATTIFNRRARLRTAALLRFICSAIAATLIGQLKSLAKQKAGAKKIAKALNPLRVRQR
jgi:hypothetical protein